MNNKPHKIVYEVTIALLIVLCILMGYKIEQLEKTNHMEPKPKYYKPLDDRLVYDERFKNQFIRTPLGGFINHSEVPNLKAHLNADFRYIKTLRHIKAGEELTLEYNLYNVK